RPGFRDQRRSRPPAYFSEDRKPTSSLNFSGFSCCIVRNDGIGDVGLPSVCAIASLPRRAPIFVRGGPGPPLPFSPILWQARQPGGAATPLPLSCRLSPVMSLSVGECAAES